MNKDFKVGDEVIYGGIKFKITKIGIKGTWADIDNDTTATSVWLRDLTPYVESPTVSNHWGSVAISEEASRQLDLAFGELSGEDESWNMEYFAEGGIEKPRASKGSDSDLYCQCSIPEIIKNQAYGNSFLYCKGCKKEKINE